MSGRSIEQSLTADRLPKGGRPTRDAAARLGAQMLDVALSHFFRHGYEGANMDAIAAEAQVSKRTLYQRYGSKQGLLLAVRDRERANYLRLVEVVLPYGTTRQKIVRTAQIILDAALSPKSKAFIGLKNEMERLGLDLDDGTEQRVVKGWTEAFRSILAADQTLASRGPERLDAIASLLLDLLVATPHHRITIRRDMADTDAAKSAYIERCLDLLSEGIVLA